MSLSPSGPSAQSTNSSVASFDYDGFQCREVSFSTANAINFNDSGDFFATHKDSMAPSEMASRDDSQADAVNASHASSTADQELDQTLTGAADTTIQHNPQPSTDATPHQTPKASDTPAFSTPVSTTEEEKNSPATWLHSLATVDAVSLLTPKAHDSSTPALEAGNKESTPSHAAPTSADESALSKASPVASSIDQLLASPEKENLVQDKNNTPKAAEEPQLKSRFRNLKTSWGSDEGKAKKGQSTSSSASTAARHMIKKFKNKAAKPMRKHAARANKRKIVKTAAVLKAKAKGRAAAAKKDVSASTAKASSSSSSSSSTAAFKKALSKSKKSQHLSEFVPLRSSKPCTSVQEIPSSLTKVPEHKYYDGYVSMAEGLVKFFSDIPQRFLSGQKSAKKEKPTMSTNRPKTTEELQVEQAKIEKERFMAKRNEFVERHPELAQQRSAGGFQKRSTYVHTDPYELDPSLPYEEAVAKQAEALRRRAEVERQERNKQMKAGLKKVLDSTEGELGICRKEVKQPTEPTTPEFLRRALMSKQQKDVQRLTEMQEAELMEKAQRQFKATGVPLFVTQAKPSKRSKRIEHVFVGARKFKSRPFKKPPTPKLERAHKKTEPKPFTRSTLYQNPRDKQEKLKEQLQQEEEQQLKEQREFKARPFTAKEAPSVARPRRKVRPQPFKSSTLYQDPRQKLEQKAKQLEEEQTPQPFKARGMPVFQEFKIERPQTMVVAEPFELESVRRAGEHKRRLEEERQQREQEEEEQRRKREKKKPLSELTNNPHFDPQQAVLRKEMSLQRAKERMEADKVAQEEQEVAQQEQMEKDRKEYRKMLNKVTFRRDMPIFPSPKSMRSETPLVEPSTPDVVRPLAVRHRKPELPAYLRK